MKREAQQVGTSQQRSVPVALLSCLLFCVVGLGVSVELTRVYALARTDPDYHSFCAVSDAVNCQVVALSGYATVLSVPTSVWAGAGYVFCMALIFLALLRRNTFGLGFLFGTGLLFVLVSCVLAYVMAARIGSLCILCLALDIVNFAILVVSFFALRTTGNGVLQAMREDIRAVLRSPLIALPLAVIAFLVLGAAIWYGRGLTTRLDTGLVAAAGQSGQGGQMGGQCEPGEHSWQKQLRTGLSPEGYPWVGAEKPLVEIHEFTDYQCPHCRRAHFTIRRLVSDYPDRLRVYHRNFPLDHKCNPTIERPFHERACELARVAVCAGYQGRFFEMNDFLFQHADEIRQKEMTAEDIARRLELDLSRFRCCMEDPEVSRAIARDIEAGRELGIQGTPAFVIDGKIYYGRIPREVIESLSMWTSK